MNSQLFADSLTSTLFDWLRLSQAAALLEFQKNTGLPVLTFQHVYLTQLRYRDLSHTGLSVLI